MLARMDAASSRESLVIAADTPERQLNAIENRLSEDPRRRKLAGLFARTTSDRGNLESVPQGSGQRDCPERAGVRVDQPGRKGWTFGHCAQSSERKRVGDSPPQCELKQLAEGVARALLWPLPLPSF